MSTIAKTINGAKTIDGVYREIQGLTMVNARHRSGKRLNDMTFDDILQHTGNELAEACLAHVMHEATETKEELCDVLSCVLHALQRLQMTTDDIHDTCINKFKARFTIEPAKQQMRLEEACEIVYELALASAHAVDEHDNAAEHARQTEAMNQVHDFIMNNVFR